MRSYIFVIWNFIDPIYFFCTRLSNLPCEESKSNFLRVRLTKYKGRNIILSDGTPINKNDTLVKIHLYNVRILKELTEIKCDLKKAKIIFRFVQESLPGVEIYIKNSKKSNEIKGIIGITLLNKGCKRLGFETFDIQNPIYKWCKWLSFLPIEVLASDNTSWQYLTKRKPNYLFMSTKQLSNKYKSNSL